MSIKTGVSAAWKNIPSISLGVGGAWKTVQSVKIGVGGVWKDLYNNFKVSINDNTLEGSGSGASETGFVTSNIGTISIVSGGVGPYTYSWEINGGAASSGPFNPVAQTGIATAFNATVSDLDVDSIEDWKCTVTDTGQGDITATVFLTVQLEWTDIT